jgi:hypothetical protein
VYILNAKHQPCFHGNPINKKIESLSHNYGKLNIHITDYMSLIGILDPFISNKDIDTLLTLHTINKEINRHLNCSVGSISKICAYEYSEGTTFSQYACSYLEHIKKCKRENFLKNYDLFRTNVYYLIKWALENQDAFLLENLLIKYNQSKRYKKISNAISIISNPDYSSIMFNISGLADLLNEKTKYNHWKNREISYLMKVMTPGLFNTLIKLDVLPCEWYIIKEILESGSIKYIELFLNKHQNEGNLTLELWEKIFIKITAESNFAIFSRIFNKYFQQLCNIDSGKIFFDVALSFLNIIDLEKKLFLIIKKISPLRLNHKLYAKALNCKNKELKQIVFHFYGKINARALFDIGISYSSPLLISTALKNYSPTQQQQENLAQKLGHLNLPEL